MSKLQKIKHGNVFLKNHETYYDSVVNHLNKISDLKDKKTYKWEDESTPEKYFNIDFEMNDWSNVFVKMVEDTSEEAKKSKFVSYIDVNMFETYEHLIPEFKKTINGIIKEITFIFEHKPYMASLGSGQTDDVRCKCFIVDTIPEVLEFDKELRKNNPHSTILMSKTRFFGTNYSSTENNEKYKNFYFVFDS